MIKSYSSLFCWFALTLAASLMLYHASDRVTALDRQLHGINAQIEAEQKSLHVLNAEWVYLANPARIEAEAKHYLDLSPTTPMRVVALSPQIIASLAPLRDGVAPAAPVQLAEAAAPETRGHEVLASAVTADTLPHQASNRIFAAANPVHINDHMILQHNTVTQASVDHIGTLISSLSLQP